MLLKATSKCLNQVLLCIAIFLANGQLAKSHPTVIGGDVAKQIEDCVKDTYDRFIANSQSNCVGKSHYYDSGGNQGTTVVSQPYKIGNSMAGYRFRAGSQSVTYDGGQCSFQIWASVNSEQSFSCTWYTAGCGLFKAGGHVRGHCNVGVDYVPRDGDVAKIKQFCLSKFSGGAVLPEPTSYQIDCSLP